MVNGWMTSLQVGTSVAAKVGLVAWLGMAHTLYRQALRWFRHHSTAAERSALRQVGMEAALYAETLFSHLPIESKVQEAIRYVNRVLESVGVTGLEPEISAAVAWGFRELERVADTGLPKRNPNG